MTATKRTRYRYTFVPMGRQPTVPSRGTVRRHAITAARLVANRDRTPQDIFRRPEGDLLAPWEPHKTAFPNGGLHTYTPTEQMAMEAVRVLEALLEEQVYSPAGGHEARRSGIELAIKKLRSHFKLL